TLPGVQSASIGYDHPLQANWGDSFVVEGQVTPADARSKSANFNPVSPDYFGTAGMHLLSGRVFNPLDDQDHPGVLIINEAFARSYFPNDDPLGRRLQISQPARIWMSQRFVSFEIVAVFRDAKSAGLQSASEPTYYVPSSQAPLQDMTVLVRTTSDPTSI